MVLTAGCMGGITATMAGGAAALAHDARAVGKDDDLPLCPQLKRLVVIAPLKDHHGSVVHVVGHDLHQAGVHAVHIELHTLDERRQLIDARNGLVKVVDRIEGRGLLAIDLGHLLEGLIRMQRGCPTGAAGKDQLGDIVRDQNGTGTGRSIGHVGENIFNRPRTELELVQRSDIVWMVGHMRLDLPEATPQPRDEVISDRMVHDHRGHGKGLEGLLHELRQTVGGRVQVSVLANAHETGSGPGLGALHLVPLIRGFEMKVVPKECGFGAYYSATTFMASQVVHQIVGYKILLYFTHFRY